MNPQVIELEKKSIHTDGRLDLIEQKIGQMKEGFDHSRATGSKAWEAVAKLQGELATERQRNDGLAKDLIHYREGIAALEQRLTEKIGVAKDAADEAKKAANTASETSQRDFKEINKTIIWGVVGSLIVLGLGAGATMLIRRILGG